MTPPTVLHSPDVSLPIGSAPLVARWHLLKYSNPFVVMGLRYIMIWSLPNDNILLDFSLKAWPTFARKENHSQTKGRDFCSSATPPNPAPVVSGVTMWDSMDWECAVNSLVGPYSKVY